MKADKVIIGAGFYGLYAALYCAKRGEDIVVIEKEEKPFTRATYVNQARIHMGYHYPRSLSTALKSAHYFSRFVNDYGFCLNTEFEKVYATSSKGSWTDATEFMKFCKSVGIYCEEFPASRYFRTGMCDGAFLTKEYTYDAVILRDYFLEELKKYEKVKILYKANIEKIIREAETYRICLDTGKVFETGFVLNATYASVNEILEKISGERYDIKYELCEIILCKSNEKMKKLGLTIMDGPFFSLMPFGKTGLHSLTSVTFTPHLTSYGALPSFNCQKQLSDEGRCSPYCLGNCNQCEFQPKTAFNYMNQLAKKYMKDDLKIEYEKSLFSIKPILKTTELDDSRPTVIRFHSKKPTFVSVLSGKINTVYDLDEILGD